MLEVSLEEDWSCTGQMLSGAAGHLAAAGAAVKPTAVAGDPSLTVRIQGSGFRVQGSWFRV